MSPILSESECIGKCLHPGAGLSVNEMRDRNEISSIELGDLVYHVGLFV